MKQTLLGIALVFAGFLGFSLISENARALDTVVVGQPYYGYGGGGYYGGGYYGGGYYGGGYGRGYGRGFYPGYAANANNPVFQSVGGNPYFITGMQRRAGAISKGQYNQAVRQTDTLIGAGIAADPNNFTGPYVNYYGEGVYSY